MEAIEELSFVFVDAFDLDIKEAMGVELDLEVFLEVLCEVDFILGFDLSKLFVEGGVMGEGFEFFEFFEVGDPAIADALCDGVCEAWVALEEPAAGGDAIGFVVEAFGPEGGEVFENGLFEKVGVKGGDTVDAVGADDGEVGHTDGFCTPVGIALSDDAHALLEGFIVRRGDLDLA